MTDGLTAGTARVQSMPCCLDHRHAAAKHGYGVAAGLAVVVAVDQPTDAVFQPRRRLSVHPELDWSGQLERPPRREPHRAGRDVVCGGSQPDQPRIPGGERASPAGRGQAINSQVLRLADIDGPAESHKDLSHQAPPVEDKLDIGQGHQGRRRDGHRVGGSSVAPCPWVDRDMERAARRGRPGAGGGRHRHGARVARPRDDREHVVGDRDRRRRVGRPVVRHGPIGQRRAAGSEPARVIERGPTSTARSATGARTGTTTETSKLVVAEARPLEAVRSTRNVPV